MKKDTKRKIHQYVPITLMAICAIGFLIFTLINEDFSVQDFLELTRGYKEITAVCVIIAFIVKGLVVFIPYAVIAISAMALLPFPVALMTVVVGTVINISVPYWVGRLTKDDWLQRILTHHPKIRSYCEMTDNLFLLSFTLRAMNLSNEGLGLLFGSAGLKYLPYLISSGIAILPSATVYVILGADLNFVESIKSPIFWASIIIDVLMILIMTRYLKRKKKKQELEKA